MRELRQESHELLKKWLESCTRNNKISRNTVAMGIVALHHMKENYPVSRNDVISKGGEVSGARSGLGRILDTYGVPSSYLKEITTRQAHQDGQRLFDAFLWGELFKDISREKREEILLELISVLRNLANDWLKRQNLKFDIDRHQAPATWINVIVENAKGRSGGVVEQQLVGAKLARRFQGVEIPNHPAHAADRQTERMGDFTISNVVYHVTASPTRNVLQKCANNLTVGLHPILLIPREQENRVRFLAQEEEIDQQLTIISIENFIAMNIIEMATDENKDFFSILKEILDIYNSRLSEVETDLSLQISVR
jgi:hypothetical protein